MNEEGGSFSLYDWPLRQIANFLDGGGALRARDEENLAWYDVISWPGRLPTYVILQLLGPDAEPSAEARSSLPAMLALMDSQVPLEEWYSFKELED